MSSAPPPSLAEALLEPTTEAVGPPRVSPKRAR
jgi:hypothetical protein